MSLKNHLRGLIVIAAAVSLNLATQAQQAFAGAAERLVIHASELGVGKFHRRDNVAHNYGANNAWTPYILAKEASDQTPVIQKNADGSVTIFFSNLDELLNAVTKVSNDEGKKVSVLNLHGHGLPGGMWYPKDAATQASGECSDWRSSANSTDDVNYDKYYSPVSKFEIEMIRSMSESDSSGFQCTSGLTEWTAAVAAHADFKAVLAPELQVHVLSCVVGLGPVGDTYTKSIAALLVTGAAGHVTASTNFGLGDWSMPEGMGFWDYITDEQLDKDNSIYPKNRRDADIAQLGTVRVATGTGADLKSGLTANQKFLPLGFETGKMTFVPDYRARTFGPMPKFKATSIRLPGTNITIKAR